MAEDDRLPEATAATDEDVAVTPTELVDTAETVGDDHDHAEGRGFPVARLLAGLVGTTELADGAVTTDKLHDGAVTDVKLAAQKVNWVNPTYTTFGGATDKGSGFFDITGTGDAPATGTPTPNWFCLQLRHWNTAYDYRWQVAIHPADPAETYVRQVVAGAGTAWRKLWHAGNDSQIANLVRTNTSSTITGGSLTISGGGLTVSGGNIALGTTRQIVFPQENGIKINLTATNGQYGFQLDTARLILNTNRYVSLHNEAGGATYSVTFDTLTHAATFLGTITAAGLAGAAADQFAAAGHTHPPGALVPSGLVAAFRTAAEIASGWNRETALDGRIMVGDGAAVGAGMSFTAGNDSGTTWVITVGSQANTPAGGAVAAGSGSTAAPAPHTHDVSGISLVPPSRAYVFARKS